MVVNFIARPFDKFIRYFATDDMTPPQYGRRKKKDTTMENALQVFVYHLSAHFNINQKVFDAQ